MREFMAHFGFGAAVAVMLSVPFVAIAYNAAAAQERGTCSQARSQCGTQPVCQRRYQACMETGCWTVGPLKTRQVRQPHTEMSSPHSMVNNQKNRSQRLVRPTS